MSEDDVPDSRPDHSAMYNRDEAATELINAALPRCTHYVVTSGQVTPGVPPTMVSCRALALYFVPEYETDIGYVRRCEEHKADPGYGRDSPAGLQEYHYAPALRVWLEAGGETRPSR